MYFSLNSLKTSQCILRSTIGCWFQLCPPQTDFQCGMYLSSAQCGHAGRSGQAGLSERKRLVHKLAKVYSGVLRGSEDEGFGLKAMHANPEDSKKISRPYSTNFLLLCPQQIHSMKILKIERREDSFNLSLLQADWHGEEYVYHSPRFLQTVSNRTRLLMLVQELEADGLLCNDPVLALGITVADCMPVFVVHGIWRALLHSGWAGTGILRRLLEDDVFADLKAPIAGGSGTNAVLSEEVTVDRQGAIVFGPCISVEKYETSSERARLFSARFGERAVQGRNLDLRQANISLLRDIGNIPLHLWMNCTFCDRNFFSYRRMGSKYSLMLALFCSSLYNTVHKSGDQNIKPQLD